MPEFTLAKLEYHNSVFKAKNGKISRTDNDDVKEERLPLLLSPTFFLFNYKDLVLPEIA